MNKLMMMVFVIANLVGVIAAAQTTPVMDEILSLLQNKLAASNGAIACKDSNGKAVTLTLRPNSYVAAFNYVDPNDNVQNTPMPQNVQFGALPAVTVNMTASTATAQTITIIGQYRGNSLTEFGNNPQDGDRQKTTTIQVSVGSDGGLALQSVEVVEVTFYAQVDANNNLTTAIPGTTATYDYTCN